MALARAAMEEPVALVPLPLRAAVVAALVTRPRLAQQAHRAAAEGAQARAVAAVAVAAREGLAALRREQEPRLLITCQVAVGTPVALAVLRALSPRPAEAAARVLMGWRVVAVVAAVLRWAMARARLVVETARAVSPGTQPRPIPVAAVAGLALLRQ